MSPRAVAPERNIDFSALRQLANLAAQNSISQYARKVLVRTMYSKLVVAAVALVAGGELLWMWKSANAARLTLFSALVALSVALYWGVEYALATGRLIVSRSGHIDINWNTSPHGQHVPLPPEDVAAEKTPPAVANPVIDKEERNERDGTAERLSGKSVSESPLPLGEG